MKVYVLIEDSGEYEDHYENILGIYESEENAQIEADKYTKLMEVYKNMPCPIDIENEMCDENKRKLYMDWISKLRDGEEFNECRIDEYETIK